MARSAFKRDANSRRLFLLTEHDRKAVEDVGRFRFLTAPQLLELNWPRVSQRRHGESRLRELFHAGWLDRQPLADSLGRPRAVYSLGHLGRVYMAGKLSVPASIVAARPAKERGRDLFFLKHHLQTIEVAINLELAIERVGGSLVYYGEERALRAQRAPDKPEMLVIPDALIAVAVGPLVQSFCVELDRATVDLRVWQRRVADYWQWAGSEKFQRELRNPVVLIVVDATPGLAQRRLTQLKQLVEAQARQLATDASFFWFAALENTCAENVLSQPVWMVGGQEGLHKLLTESSNER